MKAKDILKELKPKYHNVEVELVIGQEDQA